MKRVIIVATYGWVFTGLLESQDTEGVTISSSSTIRKWGTTLGLGELALSGPTKDTVLDPCGVVTVPKASIVAVLDCTKWVEK